ncbi:hypothetical protein L249_7258 [Ophiocordyceps polyrhachis-furcata BCC 54312]|uniref:Uncharacterized protein n=1 Tax=Ophiocordyceps polyrhachis-furcata BCC 54312 TaxID=1330021 RepID=A0A367LAY1_9HYPO|nr:hypothetical protein L249_7258 [Ophiocordyceps polyrhachis-furcata BCC 54312]
MHDTGYKPITVSRSAASQERPQCVFPASRERCSLSIANVSGHAARSPRPPALTSNPSPAEFSRFRDVERRDYDAIEFLLRKGRRQLQEYDSPALFPFAPRLTGAPPEAQTIRVSSRTSLSPCHDLSLQARYSFTNIKMATLASIPEASTSLPDTHPIRSLQRTASFERIRPRSRVLVLSRRPARVRNPARRAHVSNATRQATSYKPDAPPEASRRHPKVRDETLVNTQSAPQSSQLNDPTVESSLSSVDLDSFPLPPTHHFVKPSTRREGVVSPPRDRLLSNTRRCFGEVAVDVARGSKHSSVDSTLVDAISRAIAQQLRLCSAAKHADRDLIHPTKSNFSPSFARGSPPDRSDRRTSLDRFAADLRNYAETAGVTHNYTDPPGSGESLRTVSALMPFRPEFRAAGLAVTSKDQAQRTPGYFSKAYASLRPRQLFNKAPGNSNAHPSQVDGPAEVPSTRTGTEISFAPSQVDEWRYALIDEVPVRKKKRNMKPKRPKRSCFPCFRAKEKSAPDGDWAHFRPAPEKTAQESHRACEPRATRSVPPVLPGIRKAEPRPPRFDSVPRSPRYVSAARQISKTKDRNALSKSVAWPRARVMKMEHSASLPTKYQAQASEGRDDDRKRRLGSRQGALPPRSKVDPHSKTEPEKDHGHVSSALPSTWVRQDGPIPNLEEELEKTARLVRTAKASGRSKQQPTSSTRRQERPTPRYDPDHVGICCRSGRGMPSTATAPPNIPVRTSSVRGSISSDDNDEAITDRDVLRGLHVAASAACDQEVDAFVRDRTGLRIRRFLADLMTLESFGRPLPGEGSEERAWRRRAEMRMLKRQVRRSRELTGVAGGFI